MILVGVISIPWLIASGAWSFLSVLMHEQPLLFIFLLIPTLYFSFKLWLWLYEVLGAVLMFLGSFVDKLENGNR